MSVYLDDKVGDYKRLVEDFLTSEYQFGEYISKAETLNKKLPQIIKEYF